MGAKTTNALARLRLATDAKRGWTYIARDSGLTIMAGTWRCLDRKGDVIAALLDGTAHRESMRADAARLLGVSERWINLFIMGYDARPAGESWSKPAYVAGAAERKRLVRDGH